MDSDKKINLIKIKMYVMQPGPVQVPSQWAFVPRVTLVMSVE